MIPITVEVKGGDKVARTIARLKNSSGQIARRTAQEYASTLHGNMKKRMQHLYWTGQLIETLRIQEDKDGYIILTESPYFMAQETGFRPHFVSADASTKSGRKFGDWIREKYMIKHIGSKVPKGLVVSKPPTMSYYIIPSINYADKKFPAISKKIIQEEVESIA